MNSVSYSEPKVKRRKFAPPPAPFLTVGKLVSLELTLAEYEIAPNARTLVRLGGKS